MCVQPPGQPESGCKTHTAPGSGVIRKSRSTREGSGSNPIGADSLSAADGKTTPKGVVIVLLSQR